MADPSSIRNKTVKSLQRTVVKMSSPEWEMALLDASEEEQELAADERQRANTARLEMENAQLKEISNRLIANEADLKEGRRNLTSALEDLEKVEAVLTAVTSFVDTVAKVVPV